MKKNYINPETNMVKIQNDAIMQSASVEGFRGGLNSTPTSTDNAVSRRGGGWDDED